MSEVKYFSKGINGFKNSGNTIIGNDVWVGSEAMIMPGVKIGDGAVIGSRSLVTKDVEPYSIIGGNPAKLIKKRFSENHIKMLVQMKWWDWNETILEKAIPILCSEDVELLYRFYEIHVKKE